MPLHRSDGRELPSWGLVVCTYCRPEVLLRCLRAAIVQTVRPIEVVVVDASPDWEQTRQRVMREGAAAGEIAWHYVRAEMPSLPAQRNQGIALATADVLFMIDDDSILYPDCAEEILKVYAWDVEGRIAGVGATPAGGPPPDGEGLPAEADPTVWVRPGDSGWWGRMRRRLRHRVSELFDRGEGSFIPYDLTWPQPAIPEACAQLGVQPARTLNGYRMTFRREAIARTKFTGLLLGSPPFEDIEATYRVSRLGALVNAPRARVCHLTWQGARLGAGAYCALWVANAAVLQVLYGREVRELARRWRRRTRRAMWLHVIKDLARGRFGLPETRGIARGRRLLNRIYRMPAPELERWYGEEQRRLRDSR